MPTDNYSCKKLWAYYVLVLLLLGINYNSFAANPNQNFPNDSTHISGPDSSAVQLAEWLKPSLRSDVVDYAKRFLGLRYVYAGRDASTGFDCSGFTHFVMKNFDIDISACSRTQSAQGKKVLLKDSKPGDLVFFRRSSRSRISHVAMIVANDHQGGIYVIHSTSRGVVVDNLMESKYWRPKIYMARDVADPFTEPYAAERAQQLLVQQAKLKSLQLDLALLSKSISI